MTDLHALKAAYLACIGIQPLEHDAAMHAMPALSTLLPCDLPLEATQCVSSCQASMSVRDEPASGQTGP